MKIEFNGKVVAGLVAAAPVVAVALFNQYGKRHMATAEESAKDYPGDDLMEGPASTRAITIDAPREKVWPLINQIGQHKAGFYSFSIFERVARFLIHNTYPPQARWQHTKAGDWVFYGQQGIGSAIIDHNPEEFYFTMLSDTRRPPEQEGAIAWLPPGMSEFGWIWNFHLIELPDGRTRLIMRNKAIAKPAEKNAWLGVITAGYMWGWSSNVMTVRMLDVLKAVAEGKSFIQL